MINHQNDQKLFIIYYLISITNVLHTSKRLIQGSELLIKFVEKTKEHVFLRLQIFIFIILKYGILLKMYNYKKNVLQLYLI